MSRQLLFPGLLMALLSLMAARPAAAFDPNTDPALVAWYQFEGNAQDSSANALHGIEHGNPNYSEGFYGMALDCDGVDDYIDCGKDPKFNITAQITFAYWIKVRQFDRQWNTVIAKGDDSWRSSRASTNMYMEAGVSGTSGNYLYCVTTVNDEKWHHIAAVYDGANFVIYVDGKREVSEPSTGNITVSTYNVYIGDNSGATGRFWNGWIDDVRIYNRAFSEAEVKSLVPPKLKAMEPKPADGTVGVGMPLLQWTKGDTAMFHNVYFGTSPDLKEADLKASRQVLTMYYHAPGLEPGATYYWRVDEIEQDGVTTYTGDVWTFVAQALTAYYPTPADAANDVPPAATLTWMPAAAALQHHMYLGASRDTVTQGAADTDKGVVDGTTFAPTGLEPLKTYYWRVDETVSGGAVKTGPVWSFTTCQPVDDFESYTDDLDAKTTIFDTWIDGLTDGLSGSTVGNFQAPFAEQTIVHGGKQSMPMDYNNIKTPFYSEATREFAPTQDWTVSGVDTLILYVRGRASNSPAPVYVALEDAAKHTASVVHPDAALAKTAEWSQWKVPLSQFTGVNLAKVKKIVIGVGDKANPKAGGKGRILVDDIALSMPAPVQ